MIIIPTALSGPFVALHSALFFLRPMGVCPSRSHILSFQTRPILPLCEVSTDPCELLTFLFSHYPSFCPLPDSFQTCEQAPSRVSFLYSQRACITMPLRHLCQPSQPCLETFSAHLSLQYGLLMTHVQPRWPPTTLDPCR